MYKDALYDLKDVFSIDELDNWTTSSGLVETAITMLNTHLPFMQAHIFVHVHESKEYREIDREGVASIPQDSLFIACLAMCDSMVEIKSFFNDFALDDELLVFLLTNTYEGQFLIPIVHRFSLLGFVLLCNSHLEHEQSQTHVQQLLEQKENSDFLNNLINRLKINLYAAHIADMRQRELLRLAEYPSILRKRSSIDDVLTHLLDDLSKEISFDTAVYYEYEEYHENLIPKTTYGLNQEPFILKIGRGISGKALEQKRAIFVPDRTSHSFFALVTEEPFFVGSLISVPIQTDKKINGILTICRTPENDIPFGVEHRYTLEIASSFIASDINNRQLYDELEKSYFSTVSSLSTALEAKDLYTKGHSERVMKYAVGIAHELGLSEDATRKIRYGAILHDIGKIGISDAIISKKTKLTSVEFNEIKKHTQIGYDIVNKSNFFSEVRDLIKYHHEKMDGTGYYEKRMGDYPWAAMIISIADIYDAFTSDRPYRKALSTEEALKEVEKLIDVHFDKRIYQALITYLNI